MTGYCMHEVGQCARLWRHSGVAARVGVGVRHGTQSVDNRTDAGHDGEERQTQD